MTPNPDRFWATVLSAVAPNAPGAVIAALAELCAADADPDERASAIERLHRGQAVALDQGCQRAADEMAEAAAILEHRDAIWASHERQRQ